MIQGSIKLQLTVLLSGMLINQHAIATDYDVHVIGINRGLGTQGFEDELGQNSSNRMVGGTLFYRYMLTPNLGIEGGYSDGKDVNGRTLYEYKHELDDQLSDVDFTAPHLAVYGKIPLDAGLGVYGKLGGTSLSIDYVVDEREMHATESAYFSAMGAEYHFTFGLGVHVEYQVIIGHHFQLGMLKTGLSYRF